MSNQEYREFLAALKKVDDEYLVSAAKAIAGNFGAIPSKRDDVRKSGGVARSPRTVDNGVSLGAHKVNLLKQFRHNLQSIGITIKSDLR